MNSFVLEKWKAGYSIVMPANLEASSVIIFNKVAIAFAHFKKINFLTNEVFIQNTKIATNSATNVKFN